MLLFGGKIHFWGEPVWHDTTRLEMGKKSRLCLFYLEIPAVKKIPLKKTLKMKLQFAAASGHSLHSHAHLFIYHLPKCDAPPAHRLTWSQVNIKQATGLKKKQIIKILDQFKYLPLVCAVPPNRVKKFFPFLSFFSMLYFCCGLRKIKLGIERKVFL